MYSAGKSEQGGAGVLAQSHRRGAGMVLLAGKGDLVVAHADNRRHHTDSPGLGLEIGSLFNVCLQITEVAAALEPRWRDAIESGRRQGID